MKRITLILFSLPTMLFAQINTTGIVLKEGTIIKAALLSDINGKDVQVGQTIDFELSENVLMDSSIIIQKGARVTGTVTEAARSKALGKKGKLAFSIDYLYLSDGKIIKLRNQVEKNLNGRGGVVAAGAVLVTPFALLIPGKNARYAKGDQFAAYVDKDVVL
jgi:hypothetical protein